MTTSIRRTTAATIAAALTAMALLGALAATQAQAALRHFDGRILSKDAQTQTFRADTEQAGVIRFHTNAGTDYERIQGGFSGLTPGMNVEITAKQRANGTWLATVVERKRTN